MALSAPIEHILNTGRQVARISHVAQESQTESQGRPENLGATGPAPIPKAFPYAVASLTDGAQTTGHDVRLIPAQLVKPFVKSNKNDFIDAEAIAEAVTRQNMRFVPIKTDDQLDLQALHRIRDRLMHRRTAAINQIRGFLLERGITFAKGPAKLRNQMPSYWKTPTRT